MTEEQQYSTSGGSGCFSKVTTTWQQILSNLSLRHPIHPLDPIAPENSDFFLIDSKIRLRVVHINPNKPRISLSDNHHHDLSKRNSLSEEYWFTKWNKPLKIGNCNCSFRRSHRLSVLSNYKSKIEETRESLLSFDVLPKRIVNVETFVERILQETLFEAFQEYYMIKTQEHGANINFAYQKDETDENDETVVLRKKNVEYNKISTRKSVVSKQPQRNSVISHRMSCVYKKSNKKKPAIMLFHGIGTSADVWEIIMASLVNKGYEVIAPDMLGHGFSSAPDKASCYTFHNLLIHAITTFDHYIGNDDKRKCILIGHSYGCSIVSALYRHRATQITQLILISGGGPTPLAAPVKNNEISPFGCIHTLFKPLLFCGLKRSFLFSSRGKHFDVCEPDPAIPHRILDYISRGQKWPEGDAAFHRRILVPTLLVHGLQDKQVTLVQQCEMERTIPRAFLELIPNAGHMAMLETPEHLTHMIMCFIDTWS